MDIVQMKNVSLKCGNRMVLENINWRIKKNEHWVILGNNGSGKTTLAGVMSGYQKFDQGEILLFGEKLTAENAERLRAKLGFVSSSYFNRCLCRENGLNIVLGGFYGQLGEREVFDDEHRMRALRFLKAFGMQQKGMYPYDLLSKGQQEKVLLCRGFMKAYPLLILDEPCSGLDLLSRETLHGLLQAAAAKKDRSIVYVTHHADEILPFFTHVLLLRQGKVFLQGPKEEVLTAENLSEFFQKKAYCRFTADGRVNFGIEMSEIAGEIWKEV